MSDAIDVGPGGLRLTDARERTARSRAWHARHDALLSVGRDLEQPCGPVSARVNVETNFAEISDVRVLHVSGPAKTCIETAVWAVKLPEAPFTDPWSEFELGLSANR